MILAQIPTKTVASGLASSSFPSNSTGYAYGTSLTVPVQSTIVGSGPTAPVAVSCSTKPETITNSTVGFSRASLIGAGATADQITTSRSNTSASVQVTSNVQSVNLLGGLVTAGSVEAVATSTATAAGATSTGQGSRINALSVAGLPIPLMPAPNTRLALPGIGSVVLNEQIGPVNGATTSSITINMIDIQVTLANTLGLPVGSQIIVAHATSGEREVAQPSVIDTYGYSLYVLSAGNATLGPLAPTSVGCIGGNSQINVGGVNSTAIGTTGVLTSSASGSLTASGGTTTESASVSGINLLGGLVQADGVTASAQANLAATGSSSSSVTLANAKIAGVALNTHPAVGTHISLAGIGDVYLNEPSSSNTATRAAQGVIAIDIYVTTANSFGLPVGARIIIASAYASLSNY